MTITHVGVLGSGNMGAGIAEVAAKAGFQVTVRSRREVTAGPFLAALEKTLDRQVERGHLDPDDRTAALDRVSVTSSLQDLASCDLVIEAVVEDIEVKQHLFGELSRVCRPDAILASNTSTLSIIKLAMGTHRPDRVCGLHFFNPAPLMSLVEVARPVTASDDTMAIARSFVEACGKQPVLVKDSTGFIVNALLFGYFKDAIDLAERGTATIEDIDVAMKGGCNFPMGPFALMDLIGLDVCVLVFDALYDEFRDQHLACPPVLRRMVSAGHLGRKSGRGFYDLSR